MHALLAPELAEVQMTEGPLVKYREMISAGEIEEDSRQAHAVGALQELSDRLARLQPKLMPHLLSYFAASNRQPTPKGLYLYGGVGRGKTMLMDLFFHTVPYETRQRYHFHEFMSEVHELIAGFRKSHEGDPIPLVAQDIAKRAKLLCFDELHVTDIADAMILGRLFENLFEHRVTVVATSNAAPSELYKDGLNRDLFMPFVGLLKGNMDLMRLNAAKDFRLEKFDGQELYFAPLNGASDNALDSTWRRLTGVDKGNQDALDLKGRQLMVPEAHLGVARFHFKDLCAQPLGSGDYLKLARSFHTVMIEEIPVMGPDKRDQARRFINLIDSLYDQGVRLVASAEAEPHLLYKEGDNADLFERTASRLMEMRSEAYVAGRK